MRATAQRQPVIVAGIVLGAALMWNVSNVGAVAQTLSDAYGSSLAAVGLLTTAMFATHMLIQIPAGMLADRFGPRRVAFAAVGVIAAANGLLLVASSYPSALALRLLLGLGTGCAFVAGLDLVRAGGGGPRASGLFGGVTTAVGGVALMAIPPLRDAGDWRAPYWSAALLAVAAALPLLLCGPVRPTGGAGSGLLADRRLLPLCVLHAATFGLNIIAAAWVVTLLERQGSSSTVAGAAGGAILLAGAVSRPAGGFLATESRHRPVTLWSLLVMGAAAGLLALGVPAAAAIAFVNAFASFVILIGTPLVGLTFDELPGDGCIGFAVIGALAVAATVSLRRQASPEKAAAQ